MCVDVALKMIGGGTTAAKFREVYGRHVASCRMDCQAEVNPMVCFGS
jgi:hypothetical protein